MKKIALLVLMMVLFAAPFANAWHWQKVTATANTADTTPIQIQGSDLACHGFAIWEDTKSMEVTVYMGNTYTANVFYTTILANEHFEINYYDADLTDTGIYISTTDTAKVNYISRIKRGY